MQLIVISPIVQRLFKETQYKQINVLGNSENMGRGQNRLAHYKRKMKGDDEISIFEEVQN